MVSILIVDDHPLILDALRDLFEDHDDIKIIGETKSGEEAIKLAEEHLPDIILMDLSLPDLNGIEASRRIKSKFPDIKIIVLSMHTDKAHIIESFKAGAQAYITKNYAGEEIKKAIPKVMNGDIYLCPVATNLMAEYYAKEISNLPKSLYDQLNSAEKEVFQLLAEGKTPKEIAEFLKISNRMVGIHRQHIMDRLGIYTIAGLVKYAIKEKIIKSE